MQVNAGESQGEEARGSTLKRRVVVAELPLVRMLIMLRNDPSRYGFQLEPDQVSNFHLSANPCISLFHENCAPSCLGIVSKAGQQRHLSCLITCRG